MVSDHRRGLPVTRSEREPTWSTIRAARSRIAGGPYGRGRCARCTTSAGDATGTRSPRGARLTAPTAPTRPARPRAVCTAVWTWYADYADCTTSANSGRVCRRSRPGPVVTAASSTGRGDKTAPVGAVPTARDLVRAAHGIRGRSRAPACTAASCSNQAISATFCAPVGVVGQYTGGESPLDGGRSPSATAGVAGSAASRSTQLRGSPIHSKGHWITSFRFLSVARTTRRTCA